MKLLAAAFWASFLLVDATEAKLRGVHARSPSGTPSPTSPSLSSPTHHSTLRRTVTRTITRSPSPLSALSTSSHPRSFPAGPSLSPTPKRKRVAVAKRARTPTPSPSQVPMPVAGCSHTPASPAVQPTGTCAPGRQSFALQVSDCNSPVNGQYARLHVSYFGRDVNGKPVPEDERWDAQLWFSLNACSGSIDGAPCTPGPLLSSEPTAFYLDEHRNVYVDPESPMPSNGSWALGRRLDYPAWQQNLEGTVIVQQLSFYQPGAANETKDGYAPVICDVGSTDYAAQCKLDLKSGKTETLYWGSEGDDYDAATMGKGITMTLASEYLWGQMCSGVGGISPCGAVKVIAVPVCSPWTGGFV